jgi:tetratricopeptide (TPR) repeat protein
VHATRGVADAIPLLRHAVELDPEFALAHSALGRMYADIDESDLSAESLGKAWDLKEHASDRERFFIAFNYLALVKGNLEEARKVAESWAQTYPKEAVPHTLLSGLPNKAVARFEEAASQARKAIEIDPDFGISYFNLAVNNLYLQRPDAASSALEAAAKRGLDIEEFHMLAYDLAFLRHDAAGIDRIVEQTRRRPGPVSWLPNKEAFRMAYAGHIRRARELSATAVSEAEQANERERAGLWEAGAALREAMTGDLPEARKRAAAALHRTNDREVAYGAGLALAVAGDWLKAQDIADQLESRFPEDSSVRFTYVPVIRAAIKLTRHKPGDAVEALKPAAATEMGVSRSPINTLYGALYPVYFRGLALCALGQGARAALEFQRIIEHSGVVVSDPVGALAHVQLARSYRMSGDMESAKAAYQSFLELWKEADPEIPLLRQAQAEYKQLLTRSASNRDRPGLPLF